MIESLPAEPVLATPPAIAYYNLSRGVLCGPPANARFMRLQSTWCEQKRWEDILWTTPPDLYYHLALGDTVIVHDQSEKPRLTRAQWQGLSWIRHVVSTTWYGAAEPEFSRSGMLVSGYWEEQYGRLSDRVLTYVGRFGEWAIDGPGLLEPCDCDIDRTALELERMVA